MSRAVTRLIRHAAGRALAPVLARGLVTSLLGLALWVPAVEGRADLATGFVLKLDPRLAEDRTVGAVELPSFGRARQIEGELDRETRMVGEAELRRGGTVVRADRLNYRHEDDEVLATGQVRVTRDGSVFTGPELRLRIDANEGSFISPSYYLALQGGGRGRAERIDFLGPGRSLLRAATYTTCGPESPDWELSSRTLLIDEGEAEGTARWAMMRVRDTPVMGFPYLSFPLGDERRTGFLTPSLSITSRSGAEVVAPWYWNIAPNRDLTLLPRYGARRGPQIGGEFRYLEQKNAGEARFELNPEDALTGQSRYFWQTRHGFRDVYGWSGGWDIRGVSDDNYFVDYSRTITVSADRVLPRIVSASRSLSENWSLGVSVQKFQSILDARPGPYEREPQVGFNYLNRELGPLTLASPVEFTNFRAPDLKRPQGWRVLANPQLSAPIRSAGWFAIPKVSLHLTEYGVDDRSGTGEIQLSRAVPTVSFDTGLAFERELLLGKSTFVQTLEPRLFYVRTPYREQSAFPIYDTAVADFNFSQLFAENTFVGNDRIADLNQLTAAAISRLIDPQTGAERLRVATGFRQYFSDQSVSIPGVSGRTDERSDLLAAASGPLGGQSYFDAGLQYSMATATVPRVSFAWRHQPAQDRLLNLAVRYRADQLGQADASFRWPFVDGWNGLGRLNYSFLDSGVDPISKIPNVRGPVEVLGGFEYLASCWGARIVAQRFRTSATQSTTAIFLQLELTGVGQLGQNAFNILHRNIPGYRIPQGPEQPLSRYTGYE